MHRPHDAGNAAAPTESVRAGETGQVNSNRSSGVRRAVGASPEVIEHHARRHTAECGRSDGYEWLCDCGTTVVIVCGCGNPQFVAVSPGTWCPHAAELTAAVAR